MGIQGGRLFPFRRRHRQALLPGSILPLALLISPAPAKEALADILFSNGDQLSGLTRLRYEDGHLIMEGGNVIAGATKVGLDRLYKLRIHGDAPPAADTNHLAHLKLTNGDTITGQLGSLDPDHVTIETWFAGELRFRRSMAESLEIQHSEPPIYSGPAPISDWSQDEGVPAWSLQDRKLVAERPGRIAREIKFPRQCRLSFKLAWRNSVKFRLLLFADSGGSSSPDNCYDLVMQRHFAYVRKRWKTPGGAGSGMVDRPASIPGLSRANEADMEFFIDREAGSIDFFINGRKAQSWIDADPGTGAFGDWLHLISSEEPLSISQLQVLPWHGMLPLPPGSRIELPGPFEDTEPKDPFQEEGLTITTVETSDDGEVLLMMDDSPLPVPKDRGISIKLRTEESEEPRRKRNDVRAWFRDGGHLTFEIRDITPESLVGHSQAVGDISLQLKALSHVEFDIYFEDLDSRRAGFEWETDE